MFIDEKYWITLCEQELDPDTDISELFGYAVEVNDKLAKYLRKIESTGNCEITGQHEILNTFYNAIGNLYMTPGEGCSIRYERIRPSRWV